MKLARKSVAGIGAAMAVALLAPIGIAEAATTVVTPANMDGWVIQTSGGASVTFVTGPGTPPLGVGSAQLSVGANGGDAAQLRSGNWAGTSLADVDALSYSTYVQQDGSGGQAPYIILNVDYDGNGSTDDLLFFEPVYQTAVFCPSNPQAPLVLNTWQTWDAANGCWWSVNGTAGATPGTGTKPLSVILAVEPDAALAAGNSTRIVTGFGAGAWDNFVGNADAFSITVNGANSTYDFEPFQTPTTKDQCKKNGWKTLTDDTGRKFKNQGDCVSYVDSGGTNKADG